MSLRYLSHTHYTVKCHGEEQWWYSLQSLQFSIPNPFDLLFAFYCPWGKYYLEEIFFFTLNTPSVPAGACSHPPSPYFSLSLLPPHPPFNGYFLSLARDRNKQIQGREEAGIQSSLFTFHEPRSILYKPPRQQCTTRVSLTTWIPLRRGGGGQPLAEWFRYRGYGSLHCLFSFFYSRMGPAEPSWAEVSRYEWVCVSCCLCIQPWLCVSVCHTSSRLTP